MNAGDTREGRRGPWLLLAALLSLLLIAGCSSQAVQPPVVDAPNPTAPSTSAPVASSSPSASPEPSPTATPEPTQQPLPSVLGQLGQPAAAPTTSGYRIEIARLGINLPIAEGDVQRDVERSLTPEYYAFHLPGTSMFGSGNTYIYAHARVGMFLSLWNAKLGDLVVVRTPNGPREYLVAEIHPRVPPTEISWAQQTQDTRLTLQTSTGPYGTDPRFVVVARPR